MENKVGNTIAIMAMASHFTTVLPKKNPAPSAPPSPYAIDKLPKKSWSFTVPRFQQFSVVIHMVAEGADIWQDNEF